MQNHQGSISDTTVEIERLEISKLRLEILYLERPFWKRPSYILAALPTMLATLTLIYGIASGYFNASFIKLENQKHDLAEQIKEFDVRKSILENQIAVLESRNAELESQKKELEYKIAELRSGFDEVKSSTFGLVHILNRQLEEDVKLTKPGDPDALNKQKRWTELVRSAKQLMDTLEKLILKGAVGE